MFTAITAFFSGWRMYAALGVLAVICGLGGVVYVQSLRLDAAAQRNKALEVEKSELSDALQQSQDSLSRMRERQEVTDQLVKQLADAKAKAEKARKEVDAAYAKLKSELDAKDQACLDLPVPDGLAARLRD